MKHDKVGSVMTTDVVRATYGTPFKEVARLLAEHGVSGLPVVDEDGKVVGVVSETDLLARQADAARPEERPKRWRIPLPRRSAHRRAARARARTAGRLMSTPPVTVHADVTVAEAARTMARHRVERLPVVDDEDRLVGIVTRRDLLAVFLRPDAEIRRRVVEDVLVGTLWLAPGSVDVSVTGGVVTLTGEIERKSEREIAVSMTRQADGVVAVVDRLTHRLDDSRVHPDEPAVHGIADDWLRRT
ncbi:CBS domain-containing protein [Streptomyces sp. XM83C]|uniref:CBS domain-containing protein n=1 Tax=Streptomyces sp. XM83C TaxID=2929781 RepID=UPI001FF7CC63|nr:CBS domain-containing protein [Streptomyces sp. XM83C]MCK1823482.1 CBS domain-containing protein [Streptomyces sp. XM83C]